jgi:hypothetical protein
VTAVRGFVSHAFDDGAYLGGRKAFRDRVRELVSSACGDFAGDGIAVEHDLFFEATQFGGPLMPGVRGQIRTADFLIADITQTDPSRPVNPNVMYEIGYAMALEKRIIVMRRNDQPPPPSDIGDLLAGTYDALDDIPDKFRLRMIEIVEDTLAKADRDSDRTGRLIQKVWFPPETRSIHIVCARERQPTQFSDGCEPNYVHVDNFEDRDALLELSAFFARQYPLAHVVHHLADEMPQGVQNCDLVILGGPGCESGQGNAIARDLMEMLGSQVRYPPDGDGLYWSGGTLRPTDYENGDDTLGVLADWGSILAAPNPYNPVARVILLHGTTTYGTLAAANALIDTPVAMRNHGRLVAAGVANRLTGAFDFEALVYVEVDSRKRIKPPKLQSDTICRVQA